MTRALVLWCCIGTSAAWAQFVFDPVLELDFDRPEAWAQKYFTSVSLVTGFGAPRALPTWSVELGLEGGWVPSLSEEQQTVGFNGTKTEDLDKTGVFGRLRVTLGLPARFSLEAAYTPPVDLNGARPNLFALALARPVLESRRVRLGLRLYGQTGNVEGDFTCPADVVAAGDDPLLNPFGCVAASEDSQEMRYVGLEISNAFPLPGSRWEPYVAATVNHFDTEFRVNAEYSGVIDRTLQKTDGETWSLAAGANVRLARRWSLAAELFYTPLDVLRRPATIRENDPLFNARLLLRFALHQPAAAAADGG